ncbi:hypothetical protein KC363_g3116 [Hortaea werneckii]|nr:hypothetical protein KC325_g1197 [Hortaea werneckii]KAI6999717.1 hypothetical protein KC359_g1587 [Hortaea werneckii]KAI7149673.1 hypothetical protein KC344_g750 [Hortaea werneckii]KAI7179379.1 hypothetical protein KC360_g857 [Hortaea werneckii]KAI7192728.1 hypothetical protein KC363_g3116 [Hortaea werneckii]
MNWTTVLIFLASIASFTQADIYYAGINEAGAADLALVEHVLVATNQPLPTGSERSLIINETTIDYFIDRGVNTFRLAFRMEAMAPVQTGLGGPLNDTFFDMYNSAVEYMSRRGTYVIVDAHNYMRYGSLNSTASRHIYNPNVIFGINNEPHDMPTAMIFRNNQAAIDGIRAAGASQLILAPGNGYTGDQVWTNASVSNNGISPQYAPSSAYRGVNQLYDATRWLQQQKASGFLSEFGGGDNAHCLSVLNDTISYLENNSEWIGWAIWGAGSLLGPAYFENIEPGEGMEFNSTWLQLLEPRIKSSSYLKRFGISNRGG